MHFHRVSPQLPTPSFLSRLFKGEEKDQKKRFFVVGEDERGAVLTTLVVAPNEASAYAEASIAEPSMVMHACFSLSQMVALNEESEAARLGKTMVLKAITATNESEALEEMLEYLNKTKRTRTMRSHE